MSPQPISGQSSVFGGQSSGCDCWGGCSSCLRTTHSPTPSTLSNDVSEGAVDESVVGRAFATDDDPAQRKFPFAEM